MSNYSNTKATIAANVYTNHLNQVTAEMVKTAINSVVDTLIAGGYLYKGVAHPADAAISPDANVFYLATEVGTYTNKGGLQVADGEVAVLKYNGSWSKEVTGAATAAQVSALGQEVSENTQDIIDIRQAVNDIQPIVIEGNVTNAPDEEDITTDENDLLKFADRTTLNGMGYKILRRGSSFASQVTDVDTIYEIRYDFDLGGASVTIPARCVLKFVGGKLSNGEIIGGTFLSCGSKVFDNVSVILDKSSTISPEDFGAALDGVTDDTIALNAFFVALYKSNCKGVAAGTALISDTITIGGGCNLPDLTIKTAPGFNKTAVHIDNFRYDLVDQADQTQENMIRECTITLRAILGSGEAASTGVLINSARGITLELNRISAFENGLLLNAYDGSCGFISYCVFNIKEIVLCKYGIKMSQFQRWNDGGSIGWVTECSFYNTHIYGIGAWDEVVYIDMCRDSGNTFDGHSFISLCLEGGGNATNQGGNSIYVWAIRTKGAISNAFISCRFERTPANQNNPVIRRIADSNNYPNLFFFPRAVYATNFIENYNKAHYIVVAPALFDGTNVSTNGNLLQRNGNYETQELTSEDIGLMALQNSVSLIDKPTTSATARGAGFVMISSKADWEREANFMLWKPASGAEEIYVRFGLSTAAQAQMAGSNFQPTWYKLLINNENNKRYDITGAAISDKVPEPWDGYIYYSYYGILYYISGSWYNKEGYTGPTFGSYAQRPQNVYVPIGAFFLNNDTNRPMWKRGGTQPNHTWREADGEIGGILRHGPTTSRPTPTNIGFQYFDTTLNKPIWYTGSGWVDATGASV